MCIRDRDKTLQAETHAKGSVPACTAKGVVPASTIREKHARGSVPACRITDKNLEPPVRKGTHSRSHAMAFDELSGAEEDGREEANIHREQKEKTESYKQESELLCNFHTRWVEVLEREVLEIRRVWCSVKASTCLEARVLGGLDGAVTHTFVSFWR